MTTTTTTPGPSRPRRTTPDPAELVALAVLAPSVHDSQPWRFRVRREGDLDVVELWADQSRRLPVLDPTGRLLHVSCGAALHHLELGARAAGLDPVVRLLPDRAQPDHLATVRLRPGGAPTATTLRLVEAAPHRHSRRDPFLRREVGTPARAHLRAAALACTAWLQVVEDRGDLAVLALLNGIADGHERDDRAYRAEVAAWRRTDPDALDGITDAALPRAGVRHRHSDVDLRDFEPDAPGTRLALRRELRLLGFPQMVLRIGYGAPGGATPRRPVSEVLGTA